MLTPSSQEGYLARIPVPCLYCQNEQVVKHGKTDTGKQRYRCPNPDRSHQSFRLDPAYRGRLPEIKQQVIEMSLQPFLTTLHPSAVDIIIRRVGDAEVDEMWRFVDRKPAQR
jgi:hypothetical protein